MKKIFVILGVLMMCGTMAFAHILSEPEYSHNSSRVPINIDVSELGSYQQTEVEQQLLSEYVAVYKSVWAKKLLFVVDSLDRVALYDNKGTQLLPFIAGKPRLIMGYGNFVIMGDQSPSSEWEAFFDEVRASYGGTRKMTAGNGAAIYSLDAKKVLINDTDYDYITCTFKYPSIYFYVAKLNENDSLKWGLYSTKKQLLPCEYNYVTHTPKPQGDNSKDMFSELAKNKVALAAKQSRRQKRQASLMQAAAILGGVGNVMVAAGFTLETIQPSSSSSSDLSSDNKSTNYSSKSSEKSASSSNTTSKNADARTYSDYESQLIQMNTYYSSKYNDTSRRNIQSKMKAIRTKWEQRGFQMFHSSWEDWDGIKK